MCRSYLVMSDNNSLRLVDVSPNVCTMSLLSRKFTKTLFTKKNWVCTLDAYIDTRMNVIETENKIQCSMLSVRIPHKETLCFV